MIALLDAQIDWVAGKQLFLPRDSMIARYLLSSVSVHPSVCHKSEFYQTC